MKIPFVQHPNRSIRTTLALAVALAALAFLPTTGLAQTKGAEMLTKLNRITTTQDIDAVKPGDTVVMSCPKCKDTWVTIVQAPGKGGRKESKLVQQHQCPGCESKVVIEGQGHQAKTKVVHVCKQCGSEDAFCCVMKKGGAATKGMAKEKNAAQ